MTVITRLSVVRLYALPDWCETRPSGLDNSFLRLTWLIFLEPVSGKL